MKRTMKSLSLLLCALVILPLFAGCAATSRSAISYEDTSISRGMFQYLCCMKKTDYLYEAYGVSSSDISASQLQDNATIWAAVDADGTSVAETLKMEVMDTMHLYLYLAQYAKDAGYTLNETQKKQVQNEFDSMVVKSFETKGNFNKQMKQYGINYDQMLAYNLLQAQAYQGEELLFGEGGSMRITESSAQKYFKNNYITASCIFINTQNKKYPNGKVVVLPAEEKEAKKKLADDVFQRAQSGEDFAALCLAYSDQGVDETTAKSGYTFEKGGFVNSAAEEKAFSMTKGEVARVDTDGGVYILKREDLNQEYFTSRMDAIVKLLEDAKKLSLVTDNYDKFKHDEAFLDEVDVAALPHVV